MLVADHPICHHPFRRLGRVESEPQRSRHPQWLVALLEPCDVVYVEVPGMLFVLLYDLVDGLLLVLWSIDPGGGEAVRHHPKSRFDQLGIVGQLLQPSELALAASVLSLFLNRMTYPVFVVPTPATSTSLVAPVLCNASRMCRFAVSVSRYVVKVSSLGPFSFPPRVLIRRQLGSLLVGAEARCS